MFGIVAVLQTDDALANRHDENSEVGIRVGDAEKPAYFFLLHKSMNSLTVAGSRFGTCTVTAFTRHVVSWGEHFGLNYARPFGI